MVLQKDFTNKINKFTGDNDLVDEEMDTSNEGEEALDQEAIDLDSGDMLDSSECMSP